MNKYLINLFLVTTLLNITGCESESVLDGSDLNQSTNTGSQQEPIRLIPNEDDRFSQATGVQSAQSQTVFSVREVAVEDSLYIATFTLGETAYVNVQIENNSSTVSETLTLDDENYNKFLTDQSYVAFEALSYTPLASNFSSEWTLLSPGRYNTIIDNTDKGQVSPPFNGVDDVVRFELSILASPLYANSSSSPLNDFSENTTNGIAEIIRTSTIKDIQNEGF